MANLGEPNWQPISALPALTTHVENGVQMAAEHLATLREAQTGPHVLDDATVDRVTKTFGQTRDDLITLWVEQGRRWAALDLGATRRRDVERFQALVARELELVEQILGLADQLRGGTIERMLAKSDFELGLEALLDHLPPTSEPPTR
jgi:hypothetical protein